MSGTYWRLAIALLACALFNPFWAAASKTENRDRGSDGFGMSIDFLLNHCVNRSRYPETVPNLGVSGDYSIQIVDVSLREISSFVAAYAWTMDVVLSYFISLSVDPGYQIGLLAVSSG
jgi:hypothetical protein